MDNMVEITNDENKTQRTSGLGQTKRMQILELKMKVEAIEDDEKKMLFALRNLGEDGYEWYIDLEQKPENWCQMKDMLNAKWKYDDEKKLLEERRKLMEVEIEKRVEELIKEKMERYAEVVNSGNRMGSTRRPVMKRNNEEVVCYKCNRIGHYARGCGFANSRENNKSTRDYYFDKGNKFKMVENGNKRIKLTLDDILDEFPTVIGLMKESKVRFCNVEKCRIDTEEGKLVCKRGSRIPHMLKQKVRKYLDELLEKGIIRKSTSQWRNPIRALEKPNGEIRLVSNLMALNDLAVKDSYKLPEMKRIIDATQGANYLTILDLKEGYYQIEIIEEHKHKTAFEFEHNVYEWCGMVMGYKNAPMIFQRVMNTILAEYIGKGIEVYVDDVIIYAKTVEEHDRLVRWVFRKLANNNLRINTKKVQFGMGEVKLLGVTVNGQSRIPAEIKKNEALDFPRPRCIADLRRFLGLSGWFRDFIPNYSIMAACLYDNLKSKNEFRWEEMNEKAFVDIKQALKNAKELLLPNYEKRFVLKTDASNSGLGAVLMQATGCGKNVPLQWASKKLTKTEERYTITEKEMLAIVWAIEKFAYELKGKRFHLITDHKALEKIRLKPEFNNQRVNRWIEKIQDYDFSIEYKRAEDLVTADALSRIYENEKLSKITRPENYSVRGNKIKETLKKKHMFECEGKKFWRFDTGVIREIPEEGMRERIICDVHEKRLHRGVDTIIYDIKRNWYWPKMREDIVAVVKACEICKINNRKKTGGSEFVTSSRRYERVAIDIMHSEKEKVDILITIDYFSRMVNIAKLEDKTSKNIISKLSKVFEDYEYPSVLVCDNAREFDEWCERNRITKHLISVESHKSNGRIERVIRTIREAIIKQQCDVRDEKALRSIQNAYNDTFHSGIKCSPNEAYNDTSGIAAEENSKVGKYNQRFRRFKREKFYIGQKVRIAKLDNLGKMQKSEKGRFLGCGVILEVFDNDSYLVRDDQGKIKKKRHSELKGFY